ncbi:hypothetical protein [Deinococcus sp.]|uniref:hypothetical protein n=1 Tax=Deinococcus sp. TaxID=47478 RepID=UPI0025F17443|nr:hypothetical protein [Deinococcus sp.]
MNYSLAALLLPVALLASCAPTQQGTAGRIVGTVSGQVGRVVFLNGFQPRAATPNQPDNVTVQLGQDLYSGTYSVIGGESPIGLSASFGVGGGFGGGNYGPGHSGYNGGLSAAAAPRNTARPGNLIVQTLRLDKSAIKTLTCTFQADSSGHGVGDCVGSDSAKYALQF